MEKPVNDSNTPPSLRGRYRFDEEIGSGTQGKVFKATRLADGLEVAIKQINIASVSNWKEYELFKREADALASLDLRGVAHFYEAIECLEDDPPCAYIVQEYIHGESLAKMLKRGHRFVVIDIYNIIIEILTILKTLHNHVPRIIHRDIKPSNIIITPDENDGYHASLIDFGAVANPKVQGGGSTVAGTFGYMPPEQLTGRPEPASDIYSVAAVAVHLFTGKSPADMPSKDFRLIFEPDMENMPPALVATLRQMLAPNVNLRFKDIDELINTFKNYTVNNYENIVKKNEIIQDYDKLYDTKLQNVQYIGEHGNVDIWQEFPEKTPRKLPNIYVKYLEKPLIAQPENSLIRSKDVKMGKYFLYWILLFFVFFFIIHHFISTLNIQNTYTLIISIIASIPISFFVLNRLPSIKKGKLEFEDIVTYSRTESLMSVPDRKSYATKVKKYFTELIQTGRKFMGTITKIEYMPTLQHNIETLSTTVTLDNDGRIIDQNESRPSYKNNLLIEKIRQLTDDDLDADTKHDLMASLKRSPHYHPYDYSYRDTHNRRFRQYDNGFNTADVYYMTENASHPDVKDKILQALCSNDMPYVCHGKPEWRITYRFNPPDDTNPDDLFHTFITHIAPENNYRVGDTIPILYIVEDALLKEDVISMPFPFPMEDFCTLSDLVDIKTERLFETKYADDSERIRKEYLESYDSRRVEMGIIQANIHTCFSLIPMISRFLLNDYTKLHLASMNTLRDFALKYHRLSAYKYILKYLRKTPRSYDIPDPEAIRALFLSFEKEIPFDLLDAIIDLLHDKDTNLLVKQIILERIRFTSENNFAQIAIKLNLEQVIHEFKDPEVLNRFKQWSAKTEYKLKEIKNMDEWAKDFMEYYEIKKKKMSFEEQKLTFEEQKLTFEEQKLF